MKHLFFVFLTFSLFLKMEALEHSMGVLGALKDHNSPISISTKLLDDFVEKGLSSLCIIEGERNGRLRQWWYGDRPGGTGFFITREGHMITCKHVSNVLKSPNAFLGLTGQLIKVSIVAEHPTEDIAILKIDEPHNINFSYLEMSFIPEKIGDWVFSLRGRAIIDGSYLFALPSLGKVIGYLKGKVVENVNIEYISRVVLSMGATDGNSGSPLFNLEGKVIGILTDKLGISADECAGGFVGALPIHRVKDWIEETLRSDGYFETLD